jgi:large subunit ribosomal protein L23Ae
MVKKGTQAKAVGKAVRTGDKKFKHKKHTQVHFRRPETKRTAAAPLFRRRAVPTARKLDAFAIVRQPLATERAMKLIDDNNTITFIVHPRANKKEIKEAAQKLYNIQVDKVNTLIRPDGQKKAFLKLTADFDALDVANKIGFF